MSWILATLATSSQRHGLQHARLLCPSPSPRVCPSLCPLNQWCHPTISSSVTLFSFCLQSFRASGSFPVSQLFHQVAKVLELQLQHQSFQRVFRVISFKIDWFDLLAFQGTLKSLLQHHSSEATILRLSAFFELLSFNSSALCRATQTLPWTTVSIS